MPKFKPYDYNQHTMVAINYLEQLQPGTFEHAVHYLIEREEKDNHLSCCVISACDEGPLLAE